jgi:hypothetical protein
MTALCSSELYEIACDYRGHEHHLIWVPGRHREVDPRPTALKAGSEWRDLIGTILAARPVVTE